MTNQHTKENQFIRRIHGRIVAAVFIGLVLALSAGATDDDALPPDDYVEKAEGAFVTVEWEFDIGNYYYEKDGEQNYKTAKEWLKKSAKQGEIELYALEGVTIKNQPQARPPNEHEPLMVLALIAAIVLGAWSLSKKR